MTAENAAKASNRRAKTTPKPAETAPVATQETVKSAEAAATSGETTVKVDSTEVTEETMAADNVVKITARPAQEESQQGALQLHQPTTMVWNRPVMPSDIEVKETLTIAGVRPIAASHLELFGSFLNGRPIAASSIQVRDMLPGDRPIMANTFQMVEGSILPGDRPIMLSDPRLLEASVLPGNRPIAPNDIIDPEPEALMGYLD